MRLIYFSPIKWKSFAQRSHEFVRWFHNKFEGEVLWIDPYPTRLPALKDFNRLNMAEVDSSVENPGWIQVYTPRALPFEPLMMGTWINYFLFWRKLDGIVGKFILETPCFLCIGKPSALAIKILAGNTFSGTYYDAMDHFAAFYKGLSYRAMASKDRNVAKHVDTVIASSSFLFQHFKNLGCDVRLVRNACSSARLPHRKTPLQNESSTIGYVGTIGDWFDWEFVTEVANTITDANVEIIGPLYCKPANSLPTNVKILPPMCHSDALRRMTSFKAGLIPFKSSLLTSSVDPIKYYEYRALGVPVISTVFGEMAKRKSEHGVFLAENLCDIGSLVEQAIAYTPKDIEVETFRAENDWKVRFNNADIFEQCT